MDYSRYQLWRGASAIPHTGQSEDQITCQEDVDNVVEYGVRDLVFVLEMVKVSCDLQSAE